jgi:hypothetical protein
MEPKEIKWISIERNRYHHHKSSHFDCLYLTKTGDIILTIEKNKTDTLDEFKQYEDILKEVCLTWDETKSYDFDACIRPIVRDEKLNDLGI